MDACRKPPLHSTSGNKSFVIPYSLFLVVVLTTQVVPAVRADQLALVAGEPVGTGGADLAVVVDRGFFGSFGADRARRTIL